VRTGELRSVTWGLHSARPSEGNGEPTDSHSGWYMKWGQVTPTGASRHPIPSRPLEPRACVTFGILPSISDTLINAAVILAAFGQP